MQFESKWLGTLKTRDVQQRFRGAPLWIRVGLQILEWGFILTLAGLAAYVAAHR